MAASKPSTGATIAIVLVILLALGGVGYAIVGGSSGGAAPPDGEPHKGGGKWADAFLGPLALLGGLFKRKG